MKVLKLMVPVVLASAMLAGCAASNVPDSKPVVEDKKEDVVDNKEDSSDEVVEEDTTEVETNAFMAEKPATIKVISTYGDSINSFSENYGGVYVNYYKVAVLEDGYDELKSAVDEINADIVAKAESFAAENRDIYVKPEDEFSADYGVSICRADERVVSVMVTESSYLGGPHPNSVSYSYNIDTQTGKLLTIDDVVNDMDAFVAAVDSAIRADEYYKDEVDSFFSTVAETMTKPYEYNMILTSDGVMIQFDSGILASYAVGPISTTVLAKDLDCINREYFSENATMAKELLWGVNYNGDFNNDGSADTINVNVEFADYENNYYDKFIITYNGEEYVSTNDWSWFSNAYVTNIGGNTTVLLQTSSENDYGAVSVIAFTDNGVVETTYGNAYLPRGGSFAVDEFVMNSKVDVLGSYAGYRKYVINDKYEITPAEDRFRIQHYNTDYSKITTKIDLEGYLVDLPTQSVADDMVTIPAGTDVLVYVTDEESFVWLMLEDGRAVEYNIDRSGWPMLINGMNEEDVFEFLPYAG